MPALFVTLMGHCPVLSCSTDGYSTVQSTTNWIVTYIIRWLLYSTICYCRNSYSFPSTTLAAVPSLFSLHSCPVLSTPVLTYGCCTIFYYLELLPCTLITVLNRWLLYHLLLPGTPIQYSHHRSQHMAAVPPLITWNSYPVLSSPFSIDGCCTTSYYLELLPCTLNTVLNRLLLYILLLPGTPTLY